MSESKFFCEDNLLEGHDKVSCIYCAGMAVDAELARLRGVVEAARHSLHFLRSPASGNHPARAIELDRLEKAFAALHSPAEAGIV
jgi:hypothetical protein